MTETKLLYICLSTLSFMGIFKKESEKKTLLDETKSLRERADTLLERDELSEKQENGLLENLFGHADHVTGKLIQHSNLYIEINNNPGKTGNKQRKLQVLEAELGNLEELRENHLEISKSNNNFLSKFALILK